MKKDFDYLTKLIKECINENKREETFYMFFQNLKQIKNQCDELLSMDSNQIDNVLKSGHDWASDHISTSKDDIEEVYNFFKYGKANKTLDESNSNISKIEILSDYVYRLYMTLDKNIKNKIKSEWYDDGLSRISKFYFNNINNNIIEKNDDIIRYEIIDQLEILYKYKKDNKIKELIDILLII